MEKKPIDISKRKKIVNRLETVALTTYMTAVSAYPAFVAYADGESLVFAGLNLIGTLLIIPAVIVFVLGAYHYAMANSEGDGPATSKAGKQIASGIMMGLVAALMKLAAGNKNPIGTLVHSFFTETGS